MHTTNLEPEVNTNKVFEHILALDTTSRLRIWSVGTFDEMEDDHHSSVRDRFFGRAGGISLPDWKLRFCTWIKEKRQRSSNFNDWYAFKLLPQHLEYEALQTYEGWTEGQQQQLQEVEQYWEAQVELISALKDGAVATLAPPTLKEQKLLEESKDKELALGPIVAGSSTCYIGSIDGCWSTTSI